MQQAVTLSSTVNSDGVTLDAWFHLPDPVSLPATIQVADENGQTAAFTTEVASGAGPFSPLWTLSPPSSGFTVTDGDQLAVTFPGTAVLVGNSATTLAAVATGNLLDAAGTGDVTAYTTVRGTFPASVSFVTVSYVPLNGNIPAHIELWFHPQPQGVSENVFIELTSPSVEVYNDLTGAKLFPLAGESPTATANQNIWTIPVTGTMLKTLQTAPSYLRLVFSTAQTTVDFGVLRPIPLPVTPGGINTGLPILRPSVSLAEWVNSTGIRYVGWEGSTIVAFARIAATAAEGAVGD